ncbi:hypothetical protein D3C72_1712720 [compost metagenome]
MTYVHYAVVNETCPVCGQGRILVATDRGSDSLFVVCEDCESEWSEPQQSNNSALVDVNGHASMRFVEPHELIGHPWYSFVLNDWLKNAAVSSPSGRHKK